MALYETMNQLNHLLISLTKDLAKAYRGNKTAAQRVRTGTIKLEKIAKIFRKESVTAEKGGKIKKKGKSEKPRKGVKRKKR
ncbi:MAG: hypothetical protein K2X08_07455 [Chlamydiales bacterium]|nr:hypothetical protein [Chlamydiales bacterium]